MTEKLKQAIKDWLVSGADYDTGLKHYVHVVGKGHPTIYILRKKTTGNYKALVRALCIRAGLPIPDPIPEPVKRLTESITAEPEKPNKLREDYAFLSEPGTPAELKVLVSNKITAYHEYRSAHAKLFDCVTPEDEFATVRTLVENYIENFKIHQELAHYQKTRKILGKHPVFEEMKRLKSNRNTSTVELYRKKKNIEHNIWRIEKLIREKKKPHLDFDRKQKIDKYKMELAEIDGIIGE